MESWEKVMCVIVVLFLLHSSYQDGYNKATEELADEPTYYDGVAEMKEYYEYEEIQPLENQIEDLEDELQRTKDDYECDLENTRSELENLQEEMSWYFTEMAWIYFEYAEQPMQWNGEEISNNLLEKLEENY